MKEKEPQGRRKEKGRRKEMEKWQKARVGEDKGHHAALSEGSLDEADETANKKKGKRKEDVKMVGSKERETERISCRTKLLIMGIREEKTEKKERKGGGRVG